MAAGLELYLPAIDKAVAEARAAVDRLEMLDSHPDARFAVRLLVSELFTNAVKYGRPGDARVRLALELSDAQVRAGVGDHGPGVTEGRVPLPGQDAESSRTARTASGSSSISSRPAYLIQATAPPGSPISRLTGRALPPSTGITKIRPLQASWPHSVMRVKAR